MRTPTWKEAADEALRELAATGDQFSADDLVERIGPPDLTRTPNGRNNSIGAVFSRARHAGLIEVVGYTRSTTPTRKGGLIRVWKGTP